MSEIQMKNVFFFYIPMTRARVAGAGHGKIHQLKKHRPDNFPPAAPVATRVGTPRAV
jgi:hypothetical protein